MGYRIMFAEDINNLGCTIPGVPYVLPIATADTANCNKNSNVTITVNTNDVAGTHTLTTAVTIFNQPSHGTATTSGVAAGSIKYTPTTGYTGSDTFTYTITDSAGVVSIPSIVTISVINPPPASYTNGFSRRGIFRIPKSLIPVDISGAIVTVDITATNLKTTGNGGTVTNNSGWDIRFTDVADNKLSHRIIKYTPTTGRLRAFIKLSGVVANTDYMGFIYIGKSVIATEEDISGLYTNTIDAWNARTGVGYKASSHDLTMTGVGTGTVLDESGIYTGTNSAGSFLGNNSAFYGLNAFTVEVFHSPSGTVNKEMGIICLGPSQLDAYSNHTFVIAYDDQGFYGLEPNVIVATLRTDGPVGFNRERIESAKNIQHTGLQHIAYTWATGTSGKLLVDGVQTAPTFQGYALAGASTQGTVTSGNTLAPTSGGLRFGVGPNSTLATGDYIGEIGEVRIYSNRVSNHILKAHSLSYADTSIYMGTSAFVLANSNQGPVAVPIFPASIANGSTILFDVLPLCYEPDGDTLTISGRTNGTNGATSIVNGKIQYIHSGTATTTDTFTYTITDGSLHSTSKVVVTINPMIANTDEIVTATNTINVTGTSDANRMTNFVAAINALGTATQSTEIVLADGNYNCDGLTLGTTTTNAQLKNDTLTIRYQATIPFPLTIRSQNIHGAKLMGTNFIIVLSGQNINLYKLRHEGRDLQVTGTRNRVSRCRIRAINPNIIDTFATSFRPGGILGRIDHNEITVDGWPVANYTLAGNRQKRRHAVFLDTDSSSNPTDATIDSTVNKAYVHTYFSFDSNWIHDTPAKPFTVSTVALTNAQSYDSGYCHTAALGTGSNDARFRCAGLFYRNIVEDSLTSDGVVEPKISDLTIMNNTFRRWGGTPGSIRPGKGAFNMRQGWWCTVLANYIKDTSDFHGWNGYLTMAGNVMVNGVMNLMSGNQAVDSFSGAGSNYVPAWHQRWFDNTGTIKIGKTFAGNETIKCTNCEFDRAQAQVGIVDIGQTGSIYNKPFPAIGPPTDPSTGLPQYTAAAELTSPTMSVVNVVQTGTNVTSGDVGPWSVYHPLPSWGPGFTTRDI